MNYKQFFQEEYNHALGTPSRGRIQWPGHLQGVLTLRDSVGGLQLLPFEIMAIA